MPTTPVIDPRKYYRLPWTLTDNAISWLEVTTDCNLACEGCYRDTRSVEGHKTLAEISADLDVFARERNSDVISIAGGDPLVHPEIVEVVRMIKERGWKPVLNTNGLAMTPELLHELKKAGVFGFTFHIDTSQKRGDARGAEKEIDFNPLRHKLARMLADEGGIACSFNQTVTHDTLDQIPDVLRWAFANPDIVHTVVFILYREPRFLAGKWEYYAGGKKLDTVADTYKQPSKWGGAAPLRAPDVVAKIREVDPTYEPCAYLGGTVDPRSTKWLLATRFASQKKTFGWASPRFMEVVQKTHHLTQGTWMAYTTPAMGAMGRSSALGMSLVDDRMREIAGAYLSNGLRNPSELLETTYTQSVLVIQPIDLIEDGRADMCDGCPDITVYNGKLYWSCRLEEVKEFGGFVQAVPVRDEEPASEQPSEEAPEPAPEQRAG